MKIDVVRTGGDKQFDIRTCCGECRHGLFTRWTFLCRHRNESSMTGFHWQSLVKDQQWVRKLPACENHGLCHTPLYRQNRHSSQTNLMKVTKVWLGQESNGAERSFFGFLHMFLELIKQGLL
uniref:Uncharacterized protein n=1 Tax=Salix viminalis TaxID=40686 RepID=A0A6N2MMJ2_SALVM